VTPTLSRNPTLLTLLRLGCRVTFPNGAWMQGDPETRFIDIGKADAPLRPVTADRPDYRGVWSLCRTGLQRALTDRDLAVGAGLRS
jgi:hypothetical protein